MSEFQEDLITLRGEDGEIISSCSFPDVPETALMAVDAIPTGSRERYLVAAQFAPRYAAPVELLLSAWALGEYCRENGLKLEEGLQSLGLIARKVLRRVVSAP